MTRQVVLVSGASSGIGALTVRALAADGHIVYAGMRDMTGRNRRAADELASWAHLHGTYVEAVELDVLSEESVDRAVQTVLGRGAGVDVLIHNAGHMVLGPAEAFSPAQYAAIYDVNVLGCLRLNRSVLPTMRENGGGLLIWVSSASVRGATPPYLAPYFAAKAAMESIAMSMSVEIGLFGIETAIVVPGAFVTGTNHFANAGQPADDLTAAAYEKEFPGLGRVVAQKLAALTPPEADVVEVATAIAAIVRAPSGSRPFRVHIDPIDGGSERVGALVDASRAAFYARIGMPELLDPIARRAMRSAVRRVE